MPADPINSVSLAKFSSLTFSVGTEDLGGTERSLLEVALFMFSGKELPLTPETLASLLLLLVILHFCREVTEASEEELGPARLDAMSAHKEYL